MPYVGGSLTTLFDDAARALTMEAEHDMCDEGARSVESITRMNTPVRTGALRAAWKRDPAVPTMHGGEWAWAGRVSNSTSYAADVEYGTGLWGPKHSKYLILPRTPGGVLRFIGRDGQVVFARRVMHPGSPGNHMLEIGMTVTEALVASGGMFESILARWKSAIEAKATASN